MSGVISLWGGTYSCGCDRISHICMATCRLLAKPMWMTSLRFFSKRNYPPPVKLSPSRYCPLSSKPPNLQTSKSNWKLYELTCLQRTSAIPKLSGFVQEENPVRLTLQHHGVRRRRVQTPDEHGEGIQPSSLSGLTWLVAEKVQHQPAFGLFSQRLEIKTLQHSTI